MTARGMAINRFHVPARAVIRGVKNEAPGVRTLLLEPVEENKNPGQGLRGQFPHASRAASPGQFNMLGYPGVGEAPISYSILPGQTGAKTEGLFGHTVRVAGRVTGFLDRFGEGGEVFFRGPFGRGWPLEESRGKHLLLISGGLGLAPLKPVIEIVPSLGLAGATLLHGARTAADIIFKAELPRWRETGAVRIGLTVDDRDGGEDGNMLEKEVGEKIHTGLITELIRPLRTDPARTVAFICGPEIMMRFAAKELMLKGMGGDDIHVSMERRMRCGTGHCGHCQLGPWFICKDGPVFSYSQLRELPDVIL